ncbi:hypothetical protein BGZ93_010894 [Podila epicladia]|nr:hypothetical protein BGZ92_002970 [Podila epicladia]KAG0098627.1 hypothetical protein BGZ93_010894 [Podila epicladia]
MESSSRHRYFNLFTFLGYIVLDIVGSCHELLANPDTGFWTLMAADMVAICVFVFYLLQKHLSPRSHSYLSWAILLFGWLWPLYRIGRVLTGPALFGHDQTSIVSVYGSLGQEFQFCYKASKLASESSLTLSTTMTTTSGCQSIYSKVLIHLFNFLFSAMFVWDKYIMGDNSSSIQSSKHHHASSGGKRREMVSQDMKQHIV